MPNVFARPALRPVTVCGHKIPDSTHICAFFDSTQQELDCLVPYFAEGLRQDEQVVTIRDAAKCSEHLAAVRSRMPFQLDQPIRDNQFVVMASEETYLKGGTFEAERMYAMLEEVLAGAERGPFGRVRTCGDMTWALRNMPGTDELMEYESGVNQLLARYDCTLLCAYDVNMFSGRAVMDVLATHPMVLMGDRMYENPYYVPPEEFLETLLRRGSAPLVREEAATA